MPIHADFEKIRRNMIDQYGAEKGEQVYHAWLNEHDCDDTISMDANHKAGKCKTAECLRPVKTLFPPLPFVIRESFVAKPLKIRGIAMTAGMSRNMMYYYPNEIEKFAGKLKGASVYLEHVSAFDAVGKVTDAWFDGGHTLFYEADIWEDNTIEKIRRGLIPHVSVAADYTTIEEINGKAPHNLFNAELSLVAVAGIPETNIQVMESLSKTVHIEKLDVLNVKVSCEVA